MNPITLQLTSSSLTAAEGGTTLTASVTNSATVPTRVVLGAFAGSSGAGQDAAPTVGRAAADPLAWVTIDHPLRTIGPGATEQYTVGFAPPQQAPAGQYAVRLIAYDADRPPEEYSDQAQHVELVVPARPAAPATGLPWWVYLAAGALVLIIAVVAFLLLRPPPDPPVPSPTPTPTPTATPTPTPSPTPSNPCPPPYVPRLARATDLTCVTTLSAAEARTDNDPDLQKARKDPGGTYGPETCVQGYVWREAFEGDVACVTGTVRTRTYWENRGYPEGRP